MNGYDLLEAMGGIRDRYIEEAAAETGACEERGFADKTSPNRRVHEREGINGIGSQEAGRNENPAQHPYTGAKKGKSFRKRVLRLQRWAAGAAALVCLSILLPNVSPAAALTFGDLPLVGQYFRLVTFRSYEYRDASSDALVEETKITAMSAADSKGAETDSAGQAFEAGSPESEEAEKSLEYDAALSEEEEYSEDQAAPSLEAVLAAAQVTEEIRGMAQASIEVFERSIAEETGYHSLRFLCEKVTDTKDWLCLSVLSYTSSADGFEQMTHFVINKETGRRVRLPDCFLEAADYVTPVSDNIKEQMRSLMKKPDVEFWLDSEEEPDEDFDRISPDQDFYLNDEGNLVICFNEMEVAPMYMGRQEFVIPREVTEGIRADLPGL